MVDAEQVYRAQPTAEEVAEVLSRRVAAAVGTLNPDGTVHLAYVLFLHHDGRLYFETSPITRKARNAEAAGTASMLVQGRVDRVGAARADAAGAHGRLRGRLVGRRVRQSQ
jgi:general stress protein 26